MKIGIVTMLGNSNYGNLLQNLAVQTVIENLGYEACTLNNNTSYCGVVNSGKRNKFTYSYLKNYVRSYMFNKCGCKNDRDYKINNVLPMIRNSSKFSEVFAEREELLSLFRDEHIKYNPNPVDSKEFSETSDEYLAFVCGSDVVWHPRYHKDKTADFLGFAPQYKRIAFAPSFGVSEIVDLERRNDYFNWLMGINYLSVRDESGYELVKDITGQEAIVLMDPTLCVSADKWREYVRVPVNKPSDNYSLCYFLGNMTKEYQEYIEKTSEGKEIIYICDAQDITHYATSVEELLWLIDNADMMFTDSFHGIVFSILFHTNFVSFERVEKGLNIYTRIESLLKMTGLDQCKFGNDIKNIDFCKSDQAINIRKQIMIDYLRESINDIKRIVREKTDENK